MKPRSQPATQSALSQQSCEKTGDCEQSKGCGESFHLESDCHASNEISWISRAPKHPSWEAYVNKNKRMVKDTVCKNTF